MSYTTEARPAPNVVCRKCPSTTVTYRIWESTCGGYEDHHFTCTECGHDWWVDGPDA